MIAFAKRNLKLYFMDKSAVFFSLLAVIISIGLYVLFLGDVYTREVSGAGSAAEYARELMDNWVMAGTIASASITVSLGVLGTVIEDRARRITKDFYVSPMKNSAMTGGYIICAYVVSVFMTVFTFAMAQVYTKLNGGSFIAAERLPKLLGVILITNFAATGMMAFFVSLFRSSLQAYSSASSVVGTLVGFLLGTYMPIGMYPTFVQWIIKCFPISHGAMLLRQIMMGEVMERAFTVTQAGNAAENAAGFTAEGMAEITAELEEYFGVTYYFGETAVKEGMSVFLLFATGAVFMVFACVNLSKKQK